MFNRKRKPRWRTIINLMYYQHKSRYGNFGDEITKYITSRLINKNKYKLVLNMINIPEIHLMCIGSYIHRAIDDTYIFGSGIRTPLKEEENGHQYNSLNVCAVRGPLTRQWLLNNGVHPVPKIYGDPALLLSKFYKPIRIPKLKNKIGVIPHVSNYEKYLYLKNYNDKFHLINPTGKTSEVMHSLYSCKAIISSSLHGLICADAYKIPNLWLDEYKLDEGTFKFRDYFLSQKRELVKIKNLNEYKESLLYKDGNKIDLDKLIKSFPFS